MNTPDEGLVTKREALELVVKHLEKPGVIDVPTLMELFKWQTKLTLWVLQESKQMEQHLLRQF